MGEYERVLGSLRATTGASSPPPALGGAASSPPIAPRAAADPPTADPGGLSPQTLPGPPTPVAAQVLPPAALPVPPMPVVSRVLPPAASPAPPMPVVDEIPPPAALPGPPPPAGPPAPWQPAPTAAPSELEESVMDGAITVDAGPFTDITVLSGFEQALGSVPGVRDVYVRGFEGSRAQIDVTLGQPVALGTELHRFSPVPFAITAVDAGRLSVAVQGA